MLFEEILRGGNPFYYNLTTILYLMTSAYILDDAILYLPY